jgi:hypothetical protein
MRLFSSGLGRSIVYFKQLNSAVLSCTFYTPAVLLRAGFCFSARTQAKLTRDRRGKSGDVLKRMKIASRRREYTKNQ